MQEKKWYVVHTYSGQEDKVKANLERIRESMHLEDKILQILIPKEEVVEIKKTGERRKVLKKKYPGYVLIEMVMDEKLWYLIRNTTGVTSFVGNGSMPIPLKEEEVLQITGKAPTPPPARIKKLYQVGESIQVLSGPFSAFTGNIIEINEERGKIKVLLSIFGRDTPVELDFDQIRKI